MFFSGGGGAVADAYPLVVVESDPAVVSGLRTVVSDSARSVLPVAGFEFPAVFLKKVAFDAVGLGVGPPCFRVDSEEALLKRTDERALLALCCPGCDPGDEVGNEILDSWSRGVHEWYRKYEIRTSKDGVSLEAIQTGMSGDADFDSFKTAPWDAGGTKRDETHEVRCRPMVHNVDRLTTGNTKCELTTKRLVDTNCPRLESTPGEGDASYRSTDWSAERHTSGRTLSASGMNCLPCAVAL